MTPVHHDAEAGKIARHLCELYTGDDHPDTFGTLLITGDRESIAGHIVQATLDMRDDDREDVLHSLVWSCAEMPLDTIECITLLRNLASDEYFQDVESDGDYQFQACDWDHAIRHRMKELLHRGYLRMIIDAMAEIREVKKAA